PPPGAPATDTRHADPPPPAKKPGLLGRLFFLIIAALFGAALAILAPRFAPDLVDQVTALAPPHPMEARLDTLSAELEALRTDPEQADTAAAFSARLEALQSSLTEQSETASEELSARDAAVGVLAERITTLETAHADLAAALEAAETGESLDTSALEAAIARAEDAARRSEAAQTTLSGLDADGEATDVAGLAALASQVSDLSETQDRLRTTLDALAEQTEAIATGGDGVDQLAALEASIRTTLDGVVEDAAAARAQAETTAQTVQAQDTRLSALEGAANGGLGATDGLGRLALLISVASTGEPFTDALAATRAIYPEDADLAALEAVAFDGVPSRAALALGPIGDAEPPAPAPAAPGTDAETALDEGEPPADDAEPSSDASRPPGWAFFLGARPADTASERPKRSGDVWWNTFVRVRTGARPSARAVGAVADGLGPARAAVLAGDFEAALSAAAAAADRPGLQAWRESLNARADLEARLNRAQARALAQAGGVSP
ncbi:MAG: hypothetical protein ACFB2Z_14845, partial [Maricaulaceae bacterium]